MEEKMKDGLRADTTKREREWPSWTIESENKKNARGEVEKAKIRDATTRRRQLDWGNLVPSTQR